MNTHIIFKPHRSKIKQFSRLEEQSFHFEMNICRPLYHVHSKLIFQQTRDDMSIMNISMRAKPKFDSNCNILAAIV